MQGTSGEGCQGRLAGGMQQTTQHLDTAARQYNSFLAVPQVEQSRKAKRRLVEHKFVIARPKAEALLLGKPTGRTPGSAAGQGEGGSRHTRLVLRGTQFLLVAPLDHCPTGCKANAVASSAPECGPQTVLSTARLLQFGSASRRQHQRRLSPWRRSTWMQ